MEHQRHWLPAFGGTGSTTACGLGVGAAREPVPLSSCVGPSYGQAKEVTCQKCMSHLASDKNAPDLLRVEIGQRIDPFSKG